MERMDIEFKCNKCKLIWKGSIYDCNCPECGNRGTIRTQVSDCKNSMKGMNDKMDENTKCECTISMDYEEAYHRLKLEHEETEKINCILRKEKAELEKAIIDLVLRRTIL